jgi:hypothetical protein
VTNSSRSTIGYFEDVRRVDAAAYFFFFFRWKILIKAHKNKCL